MSLSYKQLVDNNVDSFNSYTEIQRRNMAGSVLKHILTIEDQITGVYKRADSKRYPLRNMFSDSSKQTSSNKRTEALQFVESLREGIVKNSVESEERLLNEIKDGMNRGDIDYTSSLIDATDNINLKQANSRFTTDYKNLKKDYYVRIGVEDINKEIQELKTRRAEFELILDSINNNDELIMLPRQYDDLFNGVDLVKNAKAKEVSFKVLPFVNKSMSFLSQRGATLK
ncbi:MAG: hypothetical protein R6W68_11395 [Ignavibacteriaceae bacterium]